MPEQTPRMTDEPHDRLTRICGAMTATMDVHPETRHRDRAVIMLDDGEMGGIAMHGYEDPKDGLVDLVMHARAMFHSLGLGFEIIAMPGDASKLDKH